MEPHPQFSMQNRRLNSWKEIASFFERDERTVKRWEKERALPVHRVPGSARGGVFAYTSELSRWLKGPASVEEISSPPSSPSPSLSLSSLSLVEKTRHDSSSGSERSLGSSGGVAVVDRTTTLGQATQPAFVGVSEKAGWSIGRTVLVGLLALMLAAVALNFEVRQRRFVSSVRANSSPANAEAQELYLKGRYFWNKRTPDDLNRAVDAFTSAIVKDPGYAPAYVGLADCYNLLREFSVMPAGEAYPRALAAARKAVQLDDSSAEAHNSLAFATYYGDWDPVTAEREFKRAIQLNPNYVAAHHWYATFLMSVSRPQEALVEIEKAQRLQPASAPILADKALVILNNGQREQGITQLKQLEAAEPSFLSPPHYLANLYFDARDYRDFVSENKKAASLLQDKQLELVADVAEKGFARGGDQAMLKSMLKVRRELYAKGLSPAYPLAQLSALLNKKDDAITYLADALDKREECMLFTRRDPAFTALRGDPKFEELVAKIKPAQ